MDVLLVDDDAEFRDCVSLMLLDQGRDVAEASTAEVALSIPPDDLPAMLITDINLGDGMSGLALAEEAERRWPGLAVILMSGDQVGPGGELLAKIGNFLQKPFTQGALFALMAEVAARKG